MFDTVERVKDVCSSVANTVLNNFESYASSTDRGEIERPNFTTLQIDCMENDYEKSNTQVYQEDYAIKSEIVVSTEYNLSLSNFGSYASNTNTGVKTKLPKHPGHFIFQDRYEKFNDEGKKSNFETYAASTGRGIKDKEDMEIRANKFLKCSDNFATYASSTDSGDITKMTEMRNNDVSVNNTSDDSYDQDLKTVQYL